MGDITRKKKWEGVCWKCVKKEKEELHLLGVVG